MRAIVATAIAVTVLAACGDSSEVAAPETTQEVVNVYSSRHYDTDLALYEEFTEKTGIEVNRLEAEADALIERMVSEGEFSPADVLITVDAGRLWRAQQAGVLQPISSDVLESRIPESLRDPEGHWFGLSKRARVIIYNKASGRPEPMATYADLADPAHRGRLCIRSSSNIYNLSIMAAIISRDGAEAAEDWARGVAANFARPPQGNDTSQIQAVASGECEIALVNTYYLARFAGSDSEADQRVFDALGVIFPNQETTGTHVNISGAGVAANAPHRDNAIRFIEYLTEDQAQRYLADGNNEYPVSEGVAPSDAVASLGAFREDTLDLSELGTNQAEAVRVFDRAGWP